MELASRLLASLVLVLCFAVLVQSSYLRDPNICGKPVCKPPKNFKFYPEFKYLYEYESQVSTAFDVEKQNTSTLTIKANFELQFETTCHGNLQITDFTISDDSGVITKDEEEEEYGGETRENYMETVHQHVLRFYYEDGVFTELCPAEEEPVWELNFKKGILTAFQNSMERLDLNQHLIESDVNGECMTDYKLEAVNGTTLIISKQKQLSTCEKRHQLISIIPTNTYVFETKYHKWSPVVSNFSCQQYVDHNIITSVSCEESHSFLPFYNQSLGATTSATTKVFLVEEEDYYQRHDKNKVKVERRTSLLYDTQRFSREFNGSFEETTSLIISMCNMNTEELQPEFSEVFNKFIHIARYLSYQSISRLYSLSRSLCPSGKKHMTDGLPHLRSAASVEVMKDILMTEDLLPTTVSQFLFAMTLFNRPEADTIRAVKVLVLNKTADIPTYLAVTSLIHSYCKLQPSCQINEDVQSIVQHLELWIEKSVFPESDLYMVIGTLKALGNAGVNTPTLVPNLQRVISRRDLPLELRIAAISAHRHLPCGINQNFLLNIYQNQTNEEEVRIKAYLEAIKCPTHQALRFIKEVLTNEQNNQVGSFVWSHLHNLKVSALPTRMEIQAMLQSSEFSSKFDKSYLKFSRNYESSFYINEYGIGGFAMSNVIFSHKSYIPRSISTNITIILFGEPVNVAEITLDLQGFERYAEALFWKNGILSKFEKFTNAFRFLRSSQSNLKSRIDSLSNVIAEGFSVPKASLSIRMFGHEIQYSRVTQKDEVNQLLNNLNPVKIIKDFLSGQEIKIEKSMLLCDARYVTPLANGLPLNTDAIITSTVKFDLAGFINATAFTSEGQFDLEGKLRPSVAINMVGSMGVDAYYKKTEVKVVSKIYTSTAVAGNFKLKGYKFMWVSLNLPLKKSEIFSGNNQLLVVQGSREVVLDGLTTGRVATRLCSWPIMDDALGLTFCVNSLLPNASLVLDSPMVIFNGPLNVEVTLDKSDPSTQVYTLEYKMTDLEDKRILSMIFDTPGSNIKRGLVANINLEKDGPNVTLMFQTTRTQLRAQGFYRNTPEELSLTFWLDMNGKKHIDLQIALFSKPTKYGMTYEPKLQFLINNKRIAELSGSNKWVVKNEISQCEINLDFRTNRFSTTITGYVRTNNASISTNLKLDYQFESAKPAFVRLELRLGDRSTKPLTEWFGSIKFISSTYPQINTLISLNFKKSHGRLDCKAVIQTNPYLRDDDHKLVIQTEFSYHKTHNGSKLDVLVEIKKVDDDIDLKLSVATRLSPGAIALNSVIRYSKGKEITILFDLKVPKGNLLLIESNFRVTIPNAQEAMVVHAKIMEKLYLDYDLYIEAVWFSGHSITITGSYEDKSTLTDRIFILKMICTSQFFNEILLDARLHLGAKEYKTDLLVDYKNAKYRVNIHHLSPNPGAMVSNGELTWNTSTYTISNYVDMATHQGRMELHLDQYRDIHIKVSGPQSMAEMLMEVDVKWDANRDPSQKVVFKVELSRARRLNFELRSDIEYPGRTITGTVSLRHNDSDYTGLMKLEWSPTSAISVSSFLSLNLQKSGTITFFTQVFTPFENWKVTHLNYGLWMLEDITQSNASVSWGHNSSALADITYLSLTSDSQIGFSISMLLNSTIQEVSPLKGQFLYTQSSQEIRTLLDIEPSSIHRVRLEAGGKMIRNSLLSEYAGHIRFKTPFQNLTSGEISGILNMDVENNFQGGSVIALNERNINTSFEGSAKTFNESRLLLSILTPFQKYKIINGKFIFSASKAQLVAELKATAFTIGLKTIYMFKNMQDFDFQISAVTGVNVVNNLLLVGTLNNETVDFRGGWNSVLVGLTARSHYKDWYDLEYRGSLFMPFEGFRESGAVAKFLYTDKFHLEVAAAVAKAKVGLKVVSVFKPEEDFGLSDSNFCMPEMNANLKNVSTLWQALFELDTLYYPTASGHVELLNFNLNYYWATGKLQLNIIDICVQDFFSFSDKLSMKNELKVTSTHPILSEIESKFDLDGLWPTFTVVNMDLRVVTNNNTHKFDMEGKYFFQPLGTVENEGIYSVTYRLTTPFDALDHCYFNLNLQTEKYFFSSNMTIDVLDNRINMDGTLEVDENYFSLAIDFRVVSPTFALPFCHVSFTKDFSAVEKSIIVVLKYPNKKGEADNFKITTSWHFGGEEYVKLSGHVVTPYEKLSNLQSSFLYSSEPTNKDYNLEINFKNSNFAEIKLTGKVHVNKIHIVIESSLEKFRELVMNGTLIREDKRLVLDSVVSLDQSIRMDLEITSSQGVPLFMFVRMMDNRRPQNEDKVLMTVSVDLRRKRIHGAVGYDLLSDVHSGNTYINIHSEITFRPTEENWSFLVKSNHSRYKEVSLKVTVIPGKDQIFEVSIEGHTDTIPLKSEFDVVCNMWDDGRKGRVKGSVDSSPLSGDSYLEWEWDYPYKMKGLANASYVFYNVSRDLSSLVFFTSPDGVVDNVIAGTDISLNNKLWWFSTNLTVMAPALNNIAFTSFLLLPHNVKEVHSLVGKLHFTKDYKNINQVLKYSTLVSKLGAQTSLQISMNNGILDGKVLLEGGVSGAFSLLNRFNATVKKNECIINSVFNSSFTKDNIFVIMDYSKPDIIHKIRMNVHSPGHAVVILATVDFETINNMCTVINCSTPISTFPHIGVKLEAISNRDLYFRYGQLLWPNNSAMFNYTHIRSQLQSSDSFINDGILLVDFPLATRHSIELSYSYKENRGISSGVSALFYNNNTVLHGNFSRNLQTSHLEKNDLIKIHVTNIYMPLGLNYQHKLKNNPVDSERFYVDKKRIEIFKEEDTTFNITGEMNVEKTQLDNFIHLNLMHRNRSLGVKMVFCTNNTIHSSAQVILKPTVWASSSFYLFRKHTEKVSQEELRLGLSYPKRNISLSGAYHWEADLLSGHVMVEPGSHSKPVVAALTWGRPINPLHHHLVILLSHPSLEKNLTLTANMKQNEQTVLDMNAELDYALLDKRKLSISGTLKTKPKNNEKCYELTVSAKHPITRFHMEVSGAFVKKPGYLFAFKNFSYARSFLPLQFWNSSLKLDINKKSVEIQRQSLRDVAFIKSKYSREGTKHSLEGSIVKGEETNISGAGYIDFYNVRSAAAVNLTSDATEQLLVKGDYLDNRHMFFNIWRTYDDLSENDVSFLLRLNHSRLLTARYNWRTSIKQDMINGFRAGCSYVWTYTTETADFWTDFMKTEVSETVNEIWFDAEPVLQEFIDEITNVEMLKTDILYFQMVFNESYNANEFYMQDIYNMTLLLAEEIAFRDKMGDLPKIVSELWQVMGETGESVRQSILYLIETIKNLYTKTEKVVTEFLQGNTLQHFSQLIARLSSKYDKMIKDMHVTFVHYVESLWTQVAVTITDSWNRMLQVIEPAFIEFVHYVDSLFWDYSKKVVEFLYQKQSMIINSATLAKDSNFTKDLDKFYKDITKNGFLISFKKYIVMVFGMIKEKYFKVVPFGYELTEISSEIYGEIQELYKLPAVNFTFEATHAVYDKTLWLYNYFDVGRKIQQSLPFLYRKAIDVSHTALQNEIINHNRKTIFMFEPRRGELYLEQQLPMPWHSFNCIPNFEEIKEYKMITNIQKLLTPSNQTFWSLYYKYVPLLDYTDWFPPYKGQAIIGKNRHFVTFDNKHYSFLSPCSYLLAKDFVRNDFAIVLRYNQGKHVIDLLLGPYVVEIDLQSDMVTIPGHSLKVPVNLNGTLVYYEFGIISVESDMGFTIHCNVKYDICSVKLSGWYFGKTAGLLGTLDNEPSNDFMMPNGEVASDELKFTHSWLLDSGTEKCATHLPALKRTVNTTYYDICDSFFVYKTSQFSSCFPIVDPAPYSNLCHRSLSDVDSEICTSAIMYIQECLAYNVPLRTPNMCVRCEIYSNGMMQEGAFTQLKGKDVPQSSDIVFIIEAKSCNDFSTRKKSMPSFVNVLSKELYEVGITNNRFAIVIYGGDDMFNDPHNLLVDNEVFGSAKQASELFTEIPLGNGEADIFNAIRFATKLKFRAGVSKTFILITCSQCDSNSTTFDYSALNEVLIEKDITLHIIMNKEFGLEKAKSKKILYGVDAITAYTKNDYKSLRGDKDLRRQVKLSKHLHGFCNPLALDSNGTIFTASKLETSNANIAKKFLSVLAKRVAESSRPSNCQNCECTADERGIDTIDCVLCVFPTPNFADFELRDNSSFFRSLEDPSDLDYFGNDNL